MRNSYEQGRGFVPEEASFRLETREHPSSTIRPYEDRDCKQVVALMQTNFNGQAFSLFPTDVRNAYLAANREVDVRSAAKKDGTETFVSEGPNGEIDGFMLIRTNLSSIPRRGAYGELDLRRLHVSPDTQGRGTARKLLELLEQRGRDLNVASITTHASGSSRGYFEAQGWKGRTILNDMDKRGVSSLVFAAEKRLTPPEYPLYQPPTHVIYAGASTPRLEFLRQVVQETSAPIPVSQAEGEETPTSDVVEAAKSKAKSAATRLKFHSVVSSPLAVAGDVRAEIVERNPELNKYRYALANHGKPSTTGEVRNNFATMLRYAQETRKPAPYIIRSATYFHNPREPHADSYTEHDVSIWLTKEGLESLVSPSGFTEYRTEVQDKYHADVMQMAAGFALPYFLDHGFVAGINGYPFESLPHKEEVIKDALHTAIVGIDATAVKQRLGYIA